MGTLFIPKLKNQPAFNRGRLVYLDSGHSLTNLNGFYICSQKQKCKCKNTKEENIKVKDFDKSFERYTEKLKIDEETGRKLFYTIDREGVDLREILEPKEKKYKGNMDICIEAIKSDIKNKKKIKASDINFFKESYINNSKVLYEKYLLMVIMDNFKYLGKGDIKQDEIASWLTTFIDKVYISDTGRIKGMKLEGIFDYCIRLIESKIPGYLQKEKINLIDRINFPSLNLLKVMEYFRENKYRNTLSFFPFGTEYEEEKQQKQLMKKMKGADHKEILKTLIFLRELSNSPMVLMDLVMFSKNNNDSAFEYIDRKRNRFGKDIEINAVQL